MLFFITSTMYRCLIIVIGVLYPAFSSFKALNRRNGYDQVKWMMYWIVFAAFTACEVVTDLLFSWLPLYYESKILFVLWMVLPMTRGSSYLYRRVIHPNLQRHERDIDSYIAAASNKGCEVLLQFGQNGMNYAASAVLRTADHLKRSYSVGDVCQPTLVMAPYQINNNNGPVFEPEEELYQATKNLASTNYDNKNAITTKAKTAQSSKQRQKISGKKNSTSSTEANTPIGSTTRRAKKALLELDENY